MTATTNRQEIIHRRGVIAAGALVVFTVVVTAITQLTGTGERYTPQTEAVATAELLFEDRDGGVVAVFDAATGVSLIEYGENEGVFVRSVMRTVARQRRMRDLGPETPVTLSHLIDGQLWLTDPASGVQIYLDAFGSDNSGDFIEILRLEEQTLSAQAHGERS